LLDGEKAAVLERGTFKLATMALRVGGGEGGKERAKERKV